MSKAAPLPLKLASQQVGNAGQQYVAAEVHRRGGYAVTFAGNMKGIDMLASERSGDPGKARPIGIYPATGRLRDDYLRDTGQTAPSTETR